MNLFSLISDAARDMPFALAVKKNDDITFYGVHAIGQSWADEMNAKNFSSCCWVVPNGMIRSEYKTFNSDDEELLIDSFSITRGDIQIKTVPHDAGMGSVRKHLTPNSMKFIERYVYSNHNSKSQSKTSERLSAYIEDNKKNILEYKIKVFVLDEKISAFAHKIKRENLGFDEKTNLFKNKPSNQLFNFSTQQIISKIGTGAVRRFGRKSFVLSDLESSKRRTNRRVSSLFGIELKNNKNTNLRLIKENLISLNCRSGK